MECACTIRFRRDVSLDIQAHNDPTAAIFSTGEPAKCSRRGEYTISSLETQTSNLPGNYLSCSTQKLGDNFLLNRIEYYGCGLRKTQILVDSGWSHLDHIVPNMDAGS